MDGMNMFNVFDEKRVFDNLSKKNKKTLLSEQDYLELYSTIGLTPSQSNYTLLEIGCGEGIHCNHLQNIGYKVTGVDISEEAIRIAKAKVSAGSFVVGDARELNFADDSFDIVLCIMVLHHFYYSDIDKILQESIRVCKPGGKLILVEPNNYYLYNNLAYSFAHIINKSNFISSAYLSETFTLNEHSITPEMIDKNLIEPLLTADVKYFDYMGKISASGYSPSPSLFQKIRRLFDRFSKMLSVKYRYDTFSCTIRKPI